MDENQLSDEILNKLTPKQRRAIPILLMGKSIEEGCEQARISKGCYYRWSKQEFFPVALEKTREAIAKEALDRLRACLLATVNRLIELTESDDEAIRLRASSTILDHFWKAREFSSLENRLERIEEQIKQLFHINNL